jgi:hypothetical protein
MTFLEICQAVLAEADRDPDELQDVLLESGISEQHRKVIGWVKRAYQKIQRHSNFWKFHHNNGLFLTTLDSTEDYVKEGVRDILQSSLKIRLQGSTGWSPVTWVTYEDWVSAFNLVIGAKGRPIFFVPLPSQQNNQFRLYPVPNGTYELFADWYSTNGELVRKDDEPVWHPDYHEVLVWMALQDYANEYEVSDQLNPRITRQLPPLLAAFYQQYLPNPAGARALA